MAQIDYLKSLIKLWQSRPQAEARADRVEYLKKLAQMGSRLAAPRARNADLARFVTQIMDRPNDLRWRLLGANVHRRRALDAQQRRALDTLDTTPDLLGPLGELRYEPSHSRLIARFLDATSEPEVAPSLLAEFLALIGKPEATPTDPRNATVHAERWFSTGRVDISVSLPDHLVFVEVKVDSEEGDDQLGRYWKALKAEASHREGILVYLTLHDAKKSSSRVPHVRLTLETLLAAWLPHAVVGAGPRDYLARYLKSLALVMGRCGHGAFDDWSITQQSAAIQLVEGIG